MTATQPALFVTFICARDSEKGKGNGNGNGAAELIAHLARPVSEDAAFVAYLCSEAANCFVGQIFPVSGGWVPR